MIQPNVFNQAIIDQYGNYLCQKLAEQCTGQQFIQILQAVKPNMLQICLSPHGTRVIQKLLEIITTTYNPFSQQYSDEQQFQQAITFYYILLMEMQNGLKKNLLSLAQDSNGNHILLKCLVCLRFEDKQFLYDEVVLMYLQIAMHKHGCCIIQKFIEFGSPSQQEQIIYTLFSNLAIIIQDQFANYIIQYILQLPSLDCYKIYIGNFILQNFFFYARQKYSSNVMEKCIIHNIDNFKDKIIQAIIQSNSLHYLLIDKFANYVIQRCLYCSNAFQRDKLLNQILDNFDFIQQSQFGVKILQKIESQYHLQELKNYRQMLQFYQQQHSLNYFPQNQTNTKNLSLQDISLKSYQMPTQLPYPTPFNYNNLQQLPSLNAPDLASIIKNLDLNFDVNDNDTQTIAKNKLSNMQ